MLTTNDLDNYPGMDFMRLARSVLEMSQPEFAKRLDWTSGRQITKIESGDAPLKLQTRLAIEALLKREKKFSIFLEKLEQSSLQE